MTHHLWAQPHHDGSATYVSDAAPSVGDTLAVFLRLPRAGDVTRAWLRTMIDGEQIVTPTRVDRQDERDTWLRADLRVENPVQPYRWLLDGGAHGYQWLTGTGLHERDVTDASDFRVTTHPAPPTWASSAVVYQVFPDRFAKATDRPAPDWAIPSRWDEPLRGPGGERGRQFYGGDLDGVRAHLDHVASLGANTLYLTPFFPAHTTHRYDATTFDHVDPLLGGDEALARLAGAVHDRGMRLLGDLTTNHCGSTHEWFRTALADPSSPEAGFFLFTRYPQEYVGWFGHRNMPVFDHRNAELRRRLYEGRDSVVGRWLDVLDGWRIDVANMTGRHGTIDLNHEVARAIRTTMAAARRDSLLLAEHNYDFSGDLLGDGWHGAMNYSGFAKPMWQWLVPPPPGPLEHGQYLGMPRLPGGHVMAAMREFAAAAPWRAAAFGMNLIGSHDTWRPRSALRDARLVRVALALLATMPGIPMIYSGDEIGIEGVSGEDGRKPFPWDEARWDQETLAATRALFGARAASTALRTGGLRWLAVDDDVLVFAREAPGETVLVQLSRADHRPVHLPVALVGRHMSGLAGTPDVHADGYGAVVVLPAAAPGYHLWRIEA